MKSRFPKFLSNSGLCFTLVLLQAHMVFGQADLQLLSVEFSPSTVKAGGSIGEVSWFLLNNGPQPLARPTFSFDFFLSRNAIVGDADDVKIDSAFIPNPTVNWPAGSGAQQKVFEVKVPSDASGDFYVIVLVKPIGTDANIANNTTRSLNPIRINAVPLISSHPSSRSVSEGQGVTFSVVAQGTAPFSYQWLRNGSPLAGATNLTLAIASVSAGDAGNYTVIVSNPVGAAASEAAVLTVRPADLTLRLVSPAKTGSQFSVSFPTVTNRTYVLEYKDSLTNLVWRSIAGLSGNGVNRTLTDPGAGDRQRFYRVIVANQVASSFYVGEFYMTPHGENYLYRAGNAVALRLKSTNNLSTALNDLTGPNGPLRGFNESFQFGEFVILSSSADAGGQATELSLEQQQAALTAAIQTSAIQSAEPVFTDLRSGLRMAVTDELIVSLKPSVNPEQYFGADWSNVRPLPGTTDQFVLRKPKATTAQILDTAVLQSLRPGVNWAEPNFVCEVQLLANPSSDPLFGDQWHLHNTGQTGGVPGADIHALEAWGLTRGAGITIAVLDDGFDLNHPDLSANVFKNPGEVSNGVDDDRNGFIDDINGWDFGNGWAFFGVFIPEPDDNDPRPVEDDDKHGTAVAGLAAARDGNGIGVSGVAPEARILPIRLALYGSKGVFVTADKYATAIYYAAGRSSDGKGRWIGADVLNMSFGIANPDFSNEGMRALDGALTWAGTQGRNGKGCVLIAAAGNSGVAPVLFPASHSQVIAIGASTDRDERAIYSNRGDKLELMAPGGSASNVTGQPGADLTTTDRQGTQGYNKSAGNEGDYARDFRGTSAASPVTAGAAALVLSTAPTLTTTQVRQILRETTDKIGPPLAYVDGRNNDFGYGRINAFKAVKKAIEIGGGGNQPPSVAIKSPANGATFTAPANVTIEATASDPDPGGRVVSVEFLDGTTSLSQDTTDPYSITVTLGVGPHTLTAKATDDKGATKTSDPVTVTVTRDAPPSISDVLDQSTDEDKSTVRIAFTIGDDKTPVGSLNLSFSSSNRTLVPESNITLAGTGADRTLTLKPAPNEFGKTTITVTVADEAKQTASDSFVLTVAPVNDAPTLDAIADLEITAGTSREVTLTSISYGPSNENQTITVKTASSDRALIPDPTFSYTSPNAQGKLTIAPASNRTGKATITVTVQDNGGTANGGQDSITREFNVTVIDSTQPQITHQGPFEYVPGGTVQITNRFAWSGTLLSLLWRPLLPTGWQLVSTEAIGAGSPEMNPGRTAILWTGTLPPSPIQMRYTVQVPVTATGPQQIRGEVEYQLQGMVNPATSFAELNPLNLQPRGVPTTSAPEILTHPLSQTVNVGSSVTFTVDATGMAPLNFSWNFNGAAAQAIGVQTTTAVPTSSSLTINNAQPSHAGNYTVTVSNAAGSVTSQVAILTVNSSKPTANFLGVPTSGTVPLTVSLTDTSTGQITNRVWSFGDGSTTNTTATNFTHRYDRAGSYAVSLTVSGPGGADTLTRLGYIVVDGSRPFRPDSLPTGLVGYWKFDEASGTRKDTSGLQNHLSENGSVGSVNYDYWGTGERSADFNSANLILSNSNQKNLNLTGPFTFHCQLQYDTRGGWLVRRGDPSSTGFYILLESTGQLRSIFNPVSGSPDFIPQPSLAAGKWYDMAFVFDGSHMIFYLDGNLIGSKDETRAPQSNTADFYVGNSYDGRMKDAAIWNRALSPIEIKSLALGVDIVNVPKPTANFVGVATTGPAPLTVTFSDTSTGQITNRSWSFGDGFTTNTMATSLTHRYERAGSYTVSLSVSGFAGADTLTRAGYIVVDGSPGSPRRFRPDSLPTGLVGYWKFDETSGTRMDSSGLGNHLTDINTVGSAVDDYWSTGVRSADFERDNAENLRLSDSNQTNLGIAGAFTFYCQINLETAKEGWFVRKYGPGNGYFILLESTGQLRAIFNTGSGCPDLMAAPVLTAGKWYDLAFVFDGNHMIFYLNGNVIAVNDETRAPTANAADFIIGQYLDGQMKDAAIWNRALSPIEIKSLALGVDLVSQAFRPGNIPGGLVSWWKLNEISSGATAVLRRDSAGVNHLTDNNTVGTAGGFADGASANFISASNESLSVSDAAQNGLDGAGSAQSLAVAFWVKPSAAIAGGEYGVLAKRNPVPSDNAGWSFQANSQGKIEFSADSGPTSAQAQFSVPLRADTWYHVAGIFDTTSDEVRLYVDGVLVHSVPFADGVGNSTSAFEIGGKGVATRYFDGQLADIAFWNRALSQAEIRSLATGLPLQQAGIVSYWKLDETSGTRMDSVGSNHLTSNNGVSSAPGVVGNAGDFERDVAQFLAIPDSLQTGLNFANQSYSIAVWVKPESAGGFQPIVAKWSHVHTGYMLNIEQGDFYLTHDNSGLDASVRVVSGAWQHVATSWVSLANALTFWNNGAVDRSRPHVIIPSKTPHDFRLGALADPRPGNDTFDGMMDEVVVAKRDFRVEEIKTLYNRGLNGKPALD